MNIKLEKSILKGEVHIPASKSVAHRLLICAGLCDGVSKVSNITMSEDIKATINSLTAMGAEISLNGHTATVKGISTPAKTSLIDCCESGSTLRFIIPIACALGIDAEFIGKGKLPSRPITPYLRELTKKGINFNYNNTMPFSVSGKLKASQYHLEGNISSQFITGLLLALPLIDGDSEIVLTSPLESKPYVDITISCMKSFGVKIYETENGYYIKGNQKYKSANISVEGDFSQAAFFYVANALGSEVEMLNLNPLSVQGDKKILEILDDISYTLNNEIKLKAFEIDVADIPDLVPILTVLGCFCDGISKITNAARLRIKECDRLYAISECLNTLGGNVVVNGDELIIHPITEFKGGIVDSFNDHRIVMSMAIASLKSISPVIIKNAEAVNKSYPEFFRDYKLLGGNTDVINLES